MKYDYPESGEWIYPKKKGYKLACCDCGLVHKMDFRIMYSKNLKRKYIEFRVFRDERATAGIRKGMKKTLH